MGLTWQIISFLVFWMVRSGFLLSVEYAVYILAMLMGWFHELQEGDKILHKRFMEPFCHKAFLKFEANGILDTFLVC